MGHFRSEYGKILERNSKGLGNDEVNVVSKLLGWVESETKSSSHLFCWIINSTVQIV